MSEFGPWPGMCPAGVRASMAGRIGGKWKRMGKRARCVPESENWVAQADYSFPQYAQGPDPVQCQQIRQAIAQYGFAAVRRHAMATYSPEAVKIGDKCFTKKRKRSCSGPSE
jgi:hypothetical protein